MTERMTSDLHRMGCGLSVRFTFSVGQLDCEWLPRPPSRRELPRVLQAYRSARGGFLAELARRTGLAVLEVRP